MKRSILSVTDLGKEEFEILFKTTAELKKDKTHSGTILKGKHIALVFEKPSLRTRVTFEVAIHSLGGKSVYLSRQDIKLGERESVADITRNLEKWVDGIVARVFSHNVLIEMERASSIPVINALSDLEHPCQAIADYFTIFERKGTYGDILVFIGDGNNVCHSLMLLASILGGKFKAVCPEGYEPKKEIVSKAFEIREKTGAVIEILHDPYEAVKDADFIYTDVWASMGQESEREERRKIFGRFQVNEKLLSLAPPSALVMHCLPAHRGEEITGTVLDGERAIVLEQAENRLYTEMALLSMIMG